MRRRASPATGYSASRFAERSLPLAVRNPTQAVSAAGTIRAMKLDLVLWPDPVLATSTTPVGEVDEDTRKIVAEMRRIMFEHGGVGLAAPQVGIRRQIMLVCPSGQMGDETVVLDPEILSSSGRESGDEGCLSLPGIYVPVDRATSIQVRYRDQGGRTRETSLEGFPARVFQHEFDHLQGTMILDRMKDEPSRDVARAIQALKDAYSETRDMSGRDPSSMGNGNDHARNEGGAS